MGVELLALANEGLKEITAAAAFFMLTNWFI